MAERNFRVVWLRTKERTTKGAEVHEGSNRRFARTGKSVPQKRVRHSCDRRSRPDLRGARALHTPVFPGRARSQLAWNIPDEETPRACHDRQSGVSAWSRPKLIRRWRPRSVPDSIEDGPRLTPGFLPASPPCSNGAAFGSATRTVVVTGRGTRPLDF